MSCCDNYTNLYNYIRKCSVSCFTTHTSSTFESNYPEPGSTRERGYTPPPAFDAPVRGGGSRRNIDMPFDTGKLEWLGYPRVKKVWRYLYSFWQNARTWRKHAHTQTHTPHDSIGRACIASRGKNHDFRPIISELMQDRATVTIEGK